MADVMLRKRLEDSGIRARQEVGLEVGLQQAADSEAQLAAGLGCWLLCLQGCTTLDTLGHQGPPVSAPIRTDTSF